MQRRLFRCLAYALLIGQISSLPRALAQTAGDDDAVTLIETLLRDADKDLRALGLDQVRTAAPGEKATRTFAKLLDELPPEAQIGLLGALAERADRAAHDAVVGVLTKSTDAGVKQAALRALGDLGSASDLPQLLASLTSSSTDEQHAGRYSLARLPGDDVSPAIATTLAASPRELQIKLLEILAARRATNVVPDVLRVALSPEESVRRAAMITLGQLASTAQMPELVAAILAAKSGPEREAAEKQVAAVCLRETDATQRESKLVAAIDQLPVAQRNQLLSLMGRVGGPVVLQRIEAAVADPNRAIHDLGLRALSNWPDASIAPRLQQLVTTDAHPDHRTIALRALIRVAPLADQRSDGERLSQLDHAMKLCQRDDERRLVLQRASAIRSLATLHYLLPFLQQPALAESACRSIVELAHHRNLREPNKLEFDGALDKVREISHDATVIDRAERYKKGQTWTAPRAATPP